MALKKIQVKLDEGAYTPTRAYKTDAGMDIYTPEPCIISPNGAVVIDTGVHVQIPEGYVGLLLSKSGLNVKYGLTGEGVIDAGYSGSIVVKLYNSSKSSHIFKKGDKIIQLVILPVETPEIEIVDEIASGERGQNGFGSTGDKFKKK